MATETKMIIITSDEDLIQKLSIKKNPNTHIIDLDDQKQTTGMVNLALLAELSEINSKIDHACKRALDAPAENPSKSMRISKKSIDSICAVCSDRALGFNYNVLSCGPCKAFFRRNAHHNLEKLKCVKGDNQCSVEYEIRRKCARCRLDRCFAVGMRKDFIMSDEEIQLRKERLEQIRNLRSTSESFNVSSSNISTESEILSETLNEIDKMMNMDKDLVIDENTNIKEMEDILFETLSVEDWLAIENVRSSFLSTFENYRVDSNCVDLSNPSDALITWSYFFSEMALRFIKFFRQIDEFENLDGDDRFILIKYNLFSIYPISRCFSLQSINDYSFYNENQIVEHHIRFLTLCGASTKIYQSFVNMVVSVLRVSEQDSTLLILLITILIFTQGLSMNEDEPFLKDPLAVSRAQFRYTTLLWNYLINKRGEAKAIKQFIQLMNTIFLIQSETKTFQNLFRVQMTSSSTVDQIAPLLQTVLHIS